MLAFFSFVFVMSFTPGPNTIMAMVSGQKRGLRGSLRLNIGMAAGMGVIGFVAVFFASWLQNTPLFITAMKVVGSAYLLYLGYHVAISTPDDDGEDSDRFTTGLLLQFTNIKCYLYFITGLGAFQLGSIMQYLPVRWAAMVVIGSLGTFAWTIGGQLINRFYHQHYRGLNVAVALLLVFAAIDLWR
ncbi:LysE family transporter [Lacticaseibacillus baoqingensis]|uniref:LysE family transporter n=1 Tax=Lacticaseibacillus baoqingensis TaxID=2486013 RepID=A0ABW4E831_9LACO|nr:LysE family transporter [Lacticaseibacillus baoqingensis]